MDGYLYLIQSIISENIISSVFLLLMLIVFTKNLIVSNKYYKNYNNQITNLSNSLISKLNSGDDKNDLDTESLNSFLDDMKFTFLHYLVANIREGAISYKNNSKVFLKSEHIYKELDSKIFFNDHLDNAKLASVSTTLVSMGVLGTFLGLVLGIQSASEGLASTNSDIARASLEELLGGAGLAFVTSLAGLSFSLLFSILLTKNRTKTEENWLDFTNNFKKCLPIINTKNTTIITHNLEYLLKLTEKINKNHTDFTNLSKQHFHYIKEISDNSFTIKKMQADTLKVQLNNIQNILMELKR